MGKKKDEKEDLAADFFGDDDWMDDDDSEEEEDEESDEVVEHLPVAPPEGITQEVAKADAPAPPKPPDAWGDKISTAPDGGLSNAPTLHFSSVPTIPPMDETDTELATDEAPKEKPAAEPVAADAPTEEAPKEVAEALASEPPEAQAPPAIAIPSAPAPSPPAEPAESPPEAAEAEADPETEAPEFFADDLTAAEEPLVKTHDPAPARVSVNPAEERVAGPPPRPPKRELEKWVPRGDEDAWRDVATTLVSEAAVASGKERGPLLRAAGLVYLRRLGDHAGADTLLQDAVSAGLDPSQVALDRVRALQGAGREAETVPLLQQAAKDAEPTVAAELLLQAVDAAREDDVALAIELATEATRVAEDDYAAWSTLRDLRSQSDGDIDERVATLEKLASLSSGWAAAEAHLEATGLLLGAERIADAAEQLEKANAAAPTHGTVFVVLEDTLRELGDHAALAKLYGAEAKREGTRDAGWWSLLQARALSAAGKAKDADKAFERAAKAGYVLAERERQAGAVNAKDGELLARSLEREVESSEGVAKAFALYRLGDVQERELGDAKAAAASYRQALSIDPAAGPAADAVGRILTRDNALDELRALWADRLANAPEGTRAPMHQRVAEIAEAAGDAEAAEEHYRKAADATSAGVRIAAAEGLSRVLHRARRWKDLGEHWARQATTSDDVAEKADLLYRAATVGDRAATDDRAAADRLLEIVALEPAHAGALFELAMRLEALGDYKALARALDDAGDACDHAPRRSSLKYRAARIRLERGVETDKVVPGLQAAVDADGSFAPAVWALRQATASDPASQLELYRRQAQAAESPQERAWAGYAAALLAEDGREDLQGILDDQPDHPGVLALMECSILAEGDREALARIWEDALAGENDASDAPLILARSSLLRDLGRTADAGGLIHRIATLEGEDRPLRAAARIAESVGAWDVAGELLEQLPDREDAIQRARVIGRRKGDAAAALPMYRTLLSSDEVDPDAAFGAAISAARQGESDLLARAHEWMAAGEGPAAAASARWAATLHENAGRHKAALKSWHRYLALRKTSHLGFEGAARTLRNLQQADGMDALYKGADSPDPIEWAEDLSAAGGVERAVEVLKEALPEADPELPVHLHLEQALSATGDWQGVYDLLTARRESTRDESQKSTIDARRRWVLAEKLADTEAAWDLYRKLHEDTPDDREVTEALARIAGARGETSLAIQYLKELAESATSSLEAARYQRRVGEVYEGNDDVASARQAYLDALDHDNADREALDGLRRLAAREEDWAGLIQVHQREVGIADAARVIELKREIAQVTEDELEDQLVAMDAWRAVLEVAPDDPGALTHLMALAEAQSEWGTYVEVGAKLADQAKGPERTTLLRQVGIACQEQLDRDDAIRFFEQAINSDKPDLDAAGRLEELYRARGDWGGTIRALVVQADAHTDPAEKTAPLERAARLELEVRHDRLSAAEFYQRVLNIDENHPGALRFMANHLFQQRDFDAARPIYERLEPNVEDGQDLDDFDIRMELANFFFSYGEILTEAGQPDDARKRYERALDLNASHQAALAAIGPLYVASQEWKKAEQVYRQLLQLTGGHGDKKMIAGIYTDLGLVERELRLNDKAYKRFNKALELSPNHVGALKGMALVLEDRKDWSNLLNVFNNIIYHASDPADVIQAYMTKGRILDKHMARPDKAAQHYQRSLEVDPKQPGALLRMSELALRRDEWDEARVYAEKALALTGEGLGEHIALLNLILAACLQHASQEDDAGKRLATVKDADATLLEGLADPPLSDLGKLKEAVQSRL